MNVHALLLIVAAWSLAGAEETLVLVDAGKSDYEIVVPARPLPAVALAADELSHFVERSTKVRLPRVSSPTPGKRQIYLGRHPSTGVTADGLKPEGFRIKTVGGNLHIVGVDSAGDPRRVRRNHAVSCGTLFGVYEFLERFLGVLFLWHEDLGTIVPSRPRIEVPPVDLRQEPAWSSRVIIHTPAGATGELFGRRLRLGTSVEADYTHNWARLVPAETYGKDHPEYFALVDGKRRTSTPGVRQHGGQLCTTHPDVLEIASKAALDWFDRHPSDTVLALSPNDGGGFCQCDRCRALDPPANDSGEAPLTDRILTFYNEVAARVGKVRPDKRLGAFVYASYLKPPVRVKPHPNLLLAHAPNSGFNQGMTWAQERVEERAWLALAGNVHKYDIYYYGLYGSFLLPAPVTEHLVEKLRAEHEAGFKGGYLYAAPSYELLGAGHYVMAKLMWDKDADVARLERTYYDALYGKAGPDVQEYYRLLESAIRKARREGVRPSEPAVAKAFAEAENAAESGAYTIAAYGPLLTRASEILARAGRNAASEDERSRLSRLFDHHELLAATVTGLRAAGRLDSQLLFSPEDLGALRESIDRRQKARERLRLYAPTYSRELDEADEGFLNRLNPKGPYGELSRRNAGPSLTAGRASKGPDLDGEGKDDAWRAAPRYLLWDAASTALPAAGTRISFLADDASLYALVEASGPGGRVELRLAPPGNAPPIRVVLAADGVSGEPARGRVRPRPGGWSAEVAVPLVSPKGWKVEAVRPGLASLSGTLKESGGLPLHLRESHPASPLPFGTLDDASVADLSAKHNGDVQAAVSDTNAYCGKAGLAITVPRGASTAFFFETEVRPQAFYRVSLAYRNAGVVLREERTAEAPALNLACLKGRKVLSKARTGGYALEEPSVWRHCGLVFQTPEGTRTVKLTLSFPHAGKYDVDEVRIEALD